jgi:type IV pilus assembly protein PilA
MVLNKMKNLKKASGFTIVELLIVIVVIAILAAITIVAYSGITARAKNSQAQSNVESVQKVAEAYNADSGAYPSTAAQFTAGSLSTHLPTGVTLVKPTGTTQTAIVTTNATANAALMSPNPGFTIGVSTVVTSSVVTGGMIIYYDSTTNAIASQIIYYGNATAASTFTPLT